MKTSRISAILLILSGFFTAVEADTLWDNGENENQILLGNYYRIMDDFYVPGAGWWIDQAEVHGTFFGANYDKHVEVVNIRIFAADPQTGEPDVSQGNGMNIISFDETDLESGGIKLETNFQKTFLKGQRYYWIEFEVINNHDYYMRGYRSDADSYLPAQGNHSTGSGNTIYPTKGDLAFSLSGQNIKTIAVSAANDFKVKTLDDSKDALTFDVASGHSRFKPGVYQMQLRRKQPVLYSFDRNGKHMVDFKVEDPKALEFSTPLGDDMCGNAPAGLQSYCQNFVACAAYEFCGSIPIP